MTDDRDLSPVLSAWLKDGPVRMPDRVADIVGSRIAMESQRPAWRVGFDQRRTVDSRLLFVAVVTLVVVAIMAVAVIGQPPSIVPPVRPAVGPTSSASIAHPPSPSVPAIGPGLIVYEYSALPTRIHVLMRDGRAKELLPNLAGDQVTLAWSHDGAHLAFSNRDLRDPSARLRILETDAQGATPPTLLSTDCVAPACLEERDPAYDFSGTRLAFIRVRGNRVGTEETSVVAIRDLRTNEVTELESTRRPFKGNVMRHPRWAPDGRDLSFHLVTRDGDDRAASSVIYIVGVDGKRLRRLSPPDLPGGDAAGDAEWSPDGSRIVFGSEPLLDYWAGGQGDQTTAHIYTIAPDGTGLVQLDHEVGDYQGNAMTGGTGTPSWTDDGRHILYIWLKPGDGCICWPWIKVMGSDGSDPQVVARFSDCCRLYPVQQPTP